MSKGLVGPTRVLHLLTACRPPAVGWPVIAVVIDSVNFMLRRWLWSHVFQEELKTIPRWVNRDLRIILGVVIVRVVYPRSMVSTTNFDESMPDTRRAMNRNVMWHNHLPTQAVLLGWLCSQRRMRPSYWRVALAPGHMLQIRCS
jgi:hypothetical protein